MAMSSNISSNAVGHQDGHLGLGLQRSAVT